MPPIFVFGSNLAGRHGKGAALAAKQSHGAKYGVGVGRTGNAYAIPTKDQNLKTLPITEIAKYVKDFLAYAKNNPELSFQLTPVGTGLAGYKHQDIAPLFKGVELLKNVATPSEWVKILRATEMPPTTPKPFSRMATADLFKAGAKPRLVKHRGELRISLGGETPLSFDEAKAYISKILQTPKISAKDTERLNVVLQRIDNLQKQAEIQKTLPPPPGRMATAEQAAKLLAEKEFQTEQKGRKPKKAQPFYGFPPATTERRPSVPTRKQMPLPPEDAEARARRMLLGDVAGTVTRESKMALARPPIERSLQQQAEALVDDFRGKLKGPRKGTSLRDRPAEDTSLEIRKFFDKVKSAEDAKQISTELGTSIRNDIITAMMVSPHGSAVLSDLARRTSRGGAVVQSAKGEYIRVQKKPVTEPVEGQRRRNKIDRQAEREGSALARLAAIRRGRNVPEPRVSQPGPADINPTAPGTNPLLALLRRRESTQKETPVPTARKSATPTWPAVEAQKGRRDFASVMGKSRTSPLDWEKFIVGLLMQNLRKA